MDLHTLRFDFHTFAIESNGRVLTLICIVRQNLIYTLLFCVWDLVWSVHFGCKFY